MTQRQTTILGFATLIAVLGAVWFLFGDSETGRHSDRGKLLFPDLKGALNQVVHLSVQSDLNQTDIRRDNGRWIIEQKDGHPADISQVGELLRSLGDAKIALVKTANPDLYDRIGLGDTATDLSLYDGNGRVLAKLALGDRTYEDRTFSTYVRPGDAAQTYLVSGLPEVRAEASTWLEDELLKLSTGRIASIHISHPGKDTVKIQRTSPNEMFSLVGLEQGERMKSVGSLDLIAAAFADLRADDVRKADGLDVQSTQAIIKTKSFDGLSLTVHLFKTGDETGDAWATFKAQYMAPKAEDLPTLSPDVPQDGQKEADDLNARLVGWAYRLPAAKVVALDKTRDDLVEEAEIEGTANAKRKNEDE